MNVSDSLEERSLGRDSGAGLTLCAEIFFAGDSRNGNGEQWWGIPLPLPIYWNHQLGPELQNNLWGSITYGQNLDIKELMGSAFPKWEGICASHTLAGCADHRAIEMWIARSDVTFECGKSGSHPGFVIRNFRAAGRDPSTPRLAQFAPVSALRMTSVTAAESPGAAKTLHRGGRNASAPTQDHPAAAVLFPSSRS